MRIISIQYDAVLNFYKGIFVKENILVACTILLNVCFCPSLNAFQSPLERISSTSIEIISDGSDLDSFGYGNCNMMNNGELLMMKLIQSGDFVFDIGGNIGGWSLNVLSLQPSALVYSFEPEPSLFSILESNLRGFQVKLYNIGLSSEVGTSTFYFYPKYPGLSTLHRRPEVENTLNMSPEIFDVTLDRLDLFCDRESISHINFMKIDTEGNELNVLLGAKKLLKNQMIDFIQFEYGGCYLDSKSTLEEVFVYLTSFGYTLHRITPFGLIKIDQWRKELESFEYCNYLAVRNSDDSLLAK